MPLDEKSMPHHYEANEVRDRVERRAMWAAWLIVIAVGLLLLFLAKTYGPQSTLAGLFFLCVVLPAYMIGFFPGAAYLCSWLQGESFEDPYKKYRESKGKYED